MPVRLVALVLDAADPVGLARFWGSLLGWSPRDGAGGAELVPDDPAGFGLCFRPTRTPKTVANRMHLDLTSTSAADQNATVDRALALGARHHDVGQRGDEGHVVLADPEGNELCVIEPGNRFLAGCGFVGAVASDGTQQVGYFWSRALDWPLVWDQDEETAVQAVYGGPKITWGGPPVAPRSGRDRIRFDLAVTAGGDLRAEVARLVSLGATEVGPVPGGTGIELADPDGNEFTLALPAVDPH